MKMSFLFSGVVCLIIVGGFSTSFIDDQPAALPAVDSHDLNSARLLGLHQLSLKEGVSPEEFERFIAEQWNPVFNGRYPGIRLMVMRGERNAEEGEYLLVYDVQSIFVRDWYWPTTDEGSDAWSAVQDACGAACTEAWNQFGEMAEGTEWADYVAVTAK